MKGTVSNPFPLVITHTGPDLYFVKVNGELLVDPGFGGNGFYLPFQKPYSENYTGTWSSSVRNAFDGRLDTTGAYTDGNPGTINFNQLEVNSLRVYGNAGNELDYWVVTTSAGTFNPAWSTGGAQWASIPVSPGDTLLSITNTNGQGQLRAVEVNGTVLTDGANYSSGVTASAPVFTGTPQDVFDGTTSTPYGLVEGNGSPRTTVTFNLSGLVNPRMKFKNPQAAANFVVTTNWVRTHQLLLVVLNGTSSGYY